MKRRFFLRVIVLLTLSLGFQQYADAQLGGILNKAKSAVKSKVKNATDDAKENLSKEAKKKADKEVENAKSKAVSKGIESVLGDAPDCPWLMAEDADPAKVESLIKQLGSMNHEKTKEFAKQIDARVLYDQKIVEGMNNGTIPKDEGVRSKAEKELEKWNYFIRNMGGTGSHSTTFVMEKGEEGWFTNERVLIIIHTKDNVYVTARDNEGMFCSLAYTGIYADEQAVKDATKDYLFNLNEAVIMENVASKQSESYEREYNRALLCAKLIGDAIKNNKPENLEKKARPAAGSMNGTFKAKALALAKQQDSSVTDVVITSSSWDVKTNSLGIPIKRVIYGYIFKKDKVGTKASARSWAQKHMGGGKYADLTNDGVGVEADFYVK